MYQERGLEQKFVPNGEPAARSTSLCCLFSAICVVKQMVSRISYLLQFFIWLEFISGLSDKELYKRQKHCILTYLAHSTKLTLLNFALPAKACRKGRHNFFSFWQPVYIALHKFTGNQSAQVQLVGGRDDAPCPQKNLSLPAIQKCS